MQIPAVEIWPDVRSTAPDCLLDGKGTSMVRALRLQALVAVMMLAATLATAQPPAPAGISDEARTGRYFETVRKNPNLLLAFLREMPKGGDLHNHLTGSVYAESLIRWAAEDGSCVTPQMVLTPPPCRGASNSQPAVNALTNQPLYNDMVDAFSMRNWQYSGQSGHDHFFASFDKFHSVTKANLGRALAETAARAGSQHEVYQELMYPAGGDDLDELVKKSDWTEAFANQSTFEDGFARYRKKLMDNGMAQVVAAARKELDANETTRNATLRCGTQQADAGCHVFQRFLYQVARGVPKELVFGQLLMAFELATVDPRFVGLNLVMPEDWYVPLRDFSLQMQMLQYLHKLYPKVHIALHAGELVEGLVAPEDLRFHIRDSIEVGHAERIGHGVDIMNEEHPRQLMQEMAAKKILVEICLTSNDVILGVRGDKHPLHDYMRAGVPVALATDDEGVARSDMTHEYLKGAQEQDLSYAQLKRMARTSLEYGFMQGQSYWRNTNTFLPVKECAQDKPGLQAPSGPCQEFLSGSDKARLQFSLEALFRDFESTVWKNPLPAAGK